MHKDPGVLRRIQTGDLVDLEFLIYTIKTQFSLMKKTPGPMVVLLKDDKNQIEKVPQS